MNKYINQLINEVNDENVKHDTLKYFALATSRTVYEFSYIERPENNIIFSNDNKALRLTFKALKDIIDNNLISVKDNKTHCGISWGKASNWYFMYDSSVIKREALEKAREEKERLQELKKAEEQQQLERQRFEYQQFKSWYKTESINTDHDNMDLFTTIWFDNLNQNGIIPIKELIFLYNNIQDVRCLNELKSRLHIGNTTSKLIFSHLIGYKLPDTNKATEQALDNLFNNVDPELKAVKPYKTKVATIPAEQVDKYTEEFFKFNTNDTIKKCLGRKLEKDGILFYIEKTSNGYALTEANSGLKVFDGKTLKDIKDKLNNKIDEIKNIVTGSYFQNMVNKKNQLVNDYLKQIA